MAKRITQKELRGRLGFIVFGFFTYYLVEPIQTWVDANIPINPVIIGVAGILFALWWFDFT